MRIKATSRKGRLLWVVFIIVLATAGEASMSTAFASDEKNGNFQSVSQDNYELRFLGIKIKKKSDSSSDEGLFLFIWKGKDSIQIYGVRLDDQKKSISPFPLFDVHFATGWKSLGSPCATGEEWITIQPGQVETLSLGMGWVERKIGDVDPAYTDKARLVLILKDGYAASKEFPLPLSPAAK